jgi:predicted RNA-binding protein with PIN domain
MADGVYLIDGDNVAHARGSPGDHQLAREALIGDIAGWAARVGAAATVVLDGHGSDRSLGSTRVRYSRGESADTVLERLAYRQSAEEEVTVVSSDAVVRHVAQRGGVHAMSAREFLERLGSAPESSRAEPPRMRHQLGDRLPPEVRAALERIRRGK